MNEPRWLTVSMIEDMHAEQLALFGGPEGVRDSGLLESAVARPQDRWAYRVGDMAAFAAAYAFGIARNHPLVDGNKRAAFAAMMVFLRFNGVAFAPPPAEATVITQDLAAGLVNEEGLARWIRDRWPAP